MIVITGASDGLGKALAKVFTDAGKKVINVSRSENNEAQNVLADLTDGKSLEQAAQKILAIDEPLEALINCAGALSLESLDNISGAEIQKVFAANVTGAILLTSRLADRIRKDGGDIVNVASTVGTKAYKDQAAYGSSKWAMRGFSANLQLEFKDTPTRVISFCTGGFDSNIFEKATGHKNQDFTFSMKPEDIAKFMMQILDLPKNMEVSEVIINRKASQ